MNTNSGFIGFLKKHTIIYLLLREPARIVVDFPKMLRVVRSESYFPEKKKLYQKIDGQSCMAFEIPRGQPFL